jgi:hypothetical protein
MHARRVAGSGTDPEKEIKRENANCPDEPMYTKHLNTCVELALAQ